MEYHCSDDKSVASRIFEKGLDTFGDEIEFVLRYLGFSPRFHTTSLISSFDYDARNTRVFGKQHLENGIAVL